MFKQTHRELGRLKVGEKTTIIFKADNPIQVLRMTASCGCSSPKFDKSNNQVIVKYKPQPVPKHLQASGEYITKKFITVILNDGSKHSLSFAATVTN